MFATPYDLRVAVAAQTVEETSTWQTAVDVPLAEFMHPGSQPDHLRRPGVELRRLPDGPARRGDQMPPFGTKVVDQSGLAAVSTWIQSL